jgi:hypothetical protein
LLVQGGTEIGGAALRVQLEIVISASCYDQSIVARRWVKRNKGRYIDSGFMRCTQQC